MVGVTVPFVENGYLIFADVPNAKCLRNYGLVISEGNQGDASFLECFNGNGQAVSIRSNHAYNLTTIVADGVYSLETAAASTDKILHYNDFHTWL